MKNAPLLIFLISFFQVFGQVKKDEINKSKEFTSKDAYNYYLSGYACLNIGKTDSANYYFTKAVQLYQDQENYESLAPSLVCLGIICKLMVIIIKQWTITQRQKSFI